MFVVTRQHQWPDGDFVVEISSGGIDYCNPDALCKKYPGEFEEIQLLSEAVETAIEIALAWQRDKPRKRILIGCGYTHGMTMPFDGEELTEETFAELRKRAKLYDEKLPKCAQCGDILSEKKGERYGEYGEYICCSERCAEKYFAPWYDFDSMDVEELVEFCNDNDVYYSFEDDDNPTEDEISELRKDLIKQQERNYV